MTDLRILGVALLLTVANMASAQGPAGDKGADTPTLEQAKAKQQAGDLAGAIEDLNAILKRDPKLAEGFFLRGSLYQSYIPMDVKKYSEFALNDYAKALALDPKQPNWWATRADLHGALNRFKEAVADYEAWSKLEPKHPFPYINRCDIFIRTGDFEAARKMGDEAVRVAPTIPMAQMNRGRAYFHSWMFETAEQSLNEALKLQPAFGHAYSARGDLHVALEDYESALRDYFLAFQTGEQNYFTFGRAGAMQLQCGRTETAIAAFEELRRVDPQNPEWHMNAAISYALLGQPEKAKAAIDAAVMLERSTPRAWTLRGDLLWLSGKKDEAQREYATAAEKLDAEIAKAPPGAPLLGLRGYQRWQQGKVEEAIADLEKAISQNSRDYMARSMLAWILATTPDDKLRDATRAVKLASEAHELTLGRVGAILDTRAAAHASAGDFTAAIRDEQQAIELANPWRAPKFRARLNDYQNKRAFRDTLRTPPYDNLLHTLIPVPFDEPVKALAAKLSAAAPRDKKMDSAAIAKENLPAVVLIKHTHGFGSGMLISDDGYVLTCAHVVPRRGRPTIHYEAVIDGKTKSLEAKADIIAISDVRDLALLKFATEHKLSAVQLGLHTKLEAGEKHLVIGNPGIGEFVLKKTVLEGIISNPAQELGQYHKRELVQVTGAITPGCSGGPLFNDRGEVIGVVILRAGVPGAVFGFAVNMGEVREFLQLPPKKAE